MVIERGNSNSKLTIASTYGFSLPPGYYWNLRFSNIAKEGKVEVYNNDGMIYAELCYHHDMLEGVCNFYEEGFLKEKVTYRNDMMNGWCSYYMNGYEVERYLYSNGCIISKWIKENDFFREIDFQNKGYYEVGYFDENGERTGFFYVYSNNELKEENEYKNGVFVRKTKDFVKNEMIEYNENGDKIYQGGYWKISNDKFIRAGKGKEYKENRVVYVGNWVNGEKDGDGKSMKNGRVYYYGKWKKNVPDGYGKLMNRNGSVIIEGQWNNGCIKIEYGMYDYNLEDVRSDIANKNDIISYIIVGIVSYLLMISAMANIHLEEDKRIAECYGLLFVDFIMLAFLQQLHSVKSYLVLLFTFIISVYPFYTEYFFNKELFDLLKRTHQITLYRSFMELVAFIGFSYMVACYLLYLLNQLDDPSTSQDNSFSIIYRKKGWIILIIDAVLGLIVLFFSVIIIENSSYNRIDRFLGYALFVTGIGCFFCCYFLSHYGKLYLIGITLCLIISIGLLLVYYILLFLSFGYNSVFQYYDL